MLERCSLVDLHAEETLTSKQRAKLRLLLAYAHNDLTPTSGISLKVGTLPGRIELSGERAAESFSYLLGYFEKFSGSKSDCGEDVSFLLRYHILHGEFSRWDNELWFDSDHGYRVFSGGGDTLFVIQRDFVARLLLKENIMEAFGPSLGPESSDSLDNALQYLVNKVLPEHGLLPLHAATVEREGEAFVFFGDSGVGKSTLANFCFEELGLRVLSGDQIYLGRPHPASPLMAMPSPITIAQIQRESYAWCTEPKPVRALLHLVQRRNGFEFTSWQRDSALAPFLRQVVCRDEFSQLEQILDLSISFLGEKDVRLGEMSYPKGNSFWSFLDQQWKKKT